MSDAPPTLAERADACMSRLGALFAIVQREQQIDNKSRACHVAKAGFYGALSQLETILAAASDH